MTYVPLNNEDEAKLANSTLSTQLMMGVYPTQKYVNKIKKKYPTEEYDLPYKVLEQDKNLIAASNNNFEKCLEINSQMDDTIMKVGNKLNLIEISFNSSNNEKRKTKELDSKVGEFESQTNINNEKLKQINESIPDLQRKKRK